MIQRRSEAAGLGLAVGSAVAFGTLAILAKLAYRTGVDQVPLLAVRFAIAAILLAGYRAIAGPRGKLQPGAAGRLALLGAIAYAGEATLFFTALKLSPAAVVSLVFYSYPLWTTLIGFATRIEPFRWGLVAALALGLAGVAVIFSAPAGSIAGPAIALVAAVCVSVYYVLAQVLTQGVPPPASATWSAVGAAVALGLAGAGLREGFPWAALPYAAGLGLATAVAFALFFAAIDRIGSARSAVAATMEPVTTLLLAALVLGESLSWRVGLGAVLVIGTLPVLALTGRRPETEPI